MLILMSRLWACIEFSIYIDPSSKSSNIPFTSEMFFSNLDLEVGEFLVSRFSKFLTSESTVKTSSLMFINEVSSNIVWCFYWGGERQKSDGWDLLVMSWWSLTIVMFDNLGNGLIGKSGCSGVLDSVLWEDGWVCLIVRFPDSVFWSKF